jgi:hydroxymethylpyrimidine pyrophosphatase-like HAD family hydrolase
MNIRPKTVFIDIDGTLISHSGSLIGQMKKPELLPGTLEKLLEWDRNGYNIILTTGRRESMRKKTKKQLSELGIFYDKLIMGIGGGTRIIINDRKPNSTDDTCFAINIDRNQGIENIEI